MCYQESKDKMEKKLYLSRTDKKIAGVCGGIANYFGVDSTIIRIVLVFLTIVYGMGTFAYIITWAIAPKEPEDVGQQQNEYAQEGDCYDKG